MDPWARVRGEAPMFNDSGATGLAKTILMTADAVGGVLTYALTLASELAKSGTKVHLAMMGPKERPEQEAAIRAVPNVVLHQSNFALEWMDDPWADVGRAADWLRDLERQVRPDIVHLNGYCHGAAGFTAPAIIVAHSCVLSWWEAVEKGAPGDQAGAPGTPGDQAGAPGAPGDRAGAPGPSGVQAGAPGPSGDQAKPVPERYAKYKEAVKRGLTAADAVIAVSQALRSSLERHYGPLPRTAVVPNGLPAPPSRSGDKEPFVLAAGRGWDRAKNIEALARVARQLPWPVKVAGWDSAQHDGVESLGWLPPAELGGVMERASIFAHPAKYEPFGLTALEAALRGCALVLGDIPSLREVWGDAATYVRPDDDGALIETISKLTSDPERRSKLAEAANLRAQLYTPERNARAMRDVYEAIIHARRAPSLPLQQPRETRSA